MPFFGGGGNGDYHINGTNIVGGTGAMPAVIGDNDMALGNGAGAAFLNVDRTVAIGNVAMSNLTTGFENIALGYNAFGLYDPFPGSAYGNIVIGSNTLDLATFQGSGIYENVVIGHGAVNGYTAEIFQSVIIGSGASVDNSITTSVNGAVIIGNQARAMSAGGGAIAIGEFCKSGGTAIAIGYQCTAGSNAIAMGNFVSAAINELIIGDPGQPWTVVKVGGVDLLSLGGNAPTYNFDIAKVRAISGTATFSANGMNNTVVGTASMVGLTSANVWRANPNTYVESAGTAGASCGVASTQALALTPNATFGSGGFEFTSEFAFDDATAGVGNNGRFFSGLSSTGTLPNSNPSTWTSGFVGIGSDAGDANASIFYNFFFGTPTKIPLGADFVIAPNATPALWSIYIAWKPGDTSIAYTIKRKTNTNTYTTQGTVPLIDNGLAVYGHVWRNNAAVAAAVRLAISGYSVKNYLGWDSPA